MSEEKTIVSAASPSLDTAVVVSAPDEMLADILGNHKPDAFAAGVYFAARRMNPQMLSERRHRSVVIDAYDGRIEVRADGSSEITSKDGKK